jgi:hypothetical protein
MIKARDNRLLNHSIEVLELINFLSRLTLDRDQHDVVMTVPIGVVALSERRPVLLRSQKISVQSMGGTEAIASGKAHVRHVVRPESGAG